MEAALAMSPGLCGKDLLAMFASLREEFPELEAETLHTYRKRSRKCATWRDFRRGRRPAARQAAILKRMQSAAGEWHDWQRLPVRLAVPFEQWQHIRLDPTAGGASQEFLKRLLASAGAQPHSF